jgi:hypothetical protein
MQPYRERVEEIQQIHEAATPGELIPVYRRFADHSEMVDYFGQMTAGRDSADLHMVIKIDDAEEGTFQDDKGCWHKVLFTAVTGNGPSSQANAIFYADAPEAVKDLLRIIWELEKENEELRNQFAALAPILLNKCDPEFISAESPESCPYCADKVPDEWYAKTDNHFKARVHDHMRFTGHLYRCGTYIGKSMHHYTTLEERGKVCIAHTAERNDQ